MPKKLLAEFLHEQQEPFALEVYLLERGYTKGTSLDASCTFQNCAQFLKGSANGWLRKRRGVVPNCAEFTKAVFGRLVSHNNNQKIKNPQNGVRKHTPPNNADNDKFSSASGTTVFDSGSDSDVEDENDNLFSQEKADPDTKLKWRSMEDSNKQQLSPVSVLEDTESDEDSSPIVYNKNYNFNKTTQGESSSICKSSKRPTHINYVENANSYEQYMINKRALQQTKQLLIDCVREVIEKQRKEDDKSGQQLKKILGTEELWRLVCENVWLWSQDSIDETNIFNLVNSDFMASEEEWSAYSVKQKKEISMEIGDVILEGIIGEVFN